jgi:hypothetical protein
VRQKVHSSAQKPSAFANTRVVSERHGSFTYAVAGSRRRRSARELELDEEVRQLLLSNSTPGRRTRARRGSGAPSGAPARSSAFEHVRRARSPRASRAARGRATRRRGRSRSGPPPRDLPAERRDLRRDPCGRGYGTRRRSHARRFGDPARIDTRLDSRSISFENPTGAQGGGGTAHRGRKGAPQRIVAPGERLVLADIAGPGRVRHLWLTVSPMPPEVLRRLVLEVFYDGSDAPSVSVPLVDFFGCAHGRPVPLVTAFTAIQEGRGYNATVPMPFRRRIRLELWNGSARAFPLFYQIDYTLGGEPTRAACST